MLVFAVSIIPESATEVGKQRDFYYTKQVNSEGDCLALQNHIITDFAGI